MLWDNPSHCFLHANSANVNAHMAFCKWIAPIKKFRIPGTTIFKTLKYRILDNLSTSHSRIQPRAECPCKFLGPMEFLDTLWTIWQRDTVETCIAERQEVNERANSGENLKDPVNSLATTEVVSPDSRSSGEMNWHRASDNNIIRMREKIFQASNRI